jgi:hypothetical protein
MKAQILSVREPTYDKVFPSVKVGGQEPLSIPDKFSQLYPNRDECLPEKQNS